MGYREYFYEADKNFIERIQNCKTNKECVEVCKEYLHPYDGYDDYVPLRCFGREIFEFGKYYEGATDIEKCGTPLFTTEELQEQYLDYGAIVCTEDAILAAINWQRNKIINYYKSVLQEESEDPFDKRSYLDRLKASVDDSLFWWEKFGGVNLDKDSPLLAHSWCYDHTIFDLVRIYKTFDWENKVLLFMGW